MNKTLHTDLLKLSEIRKKVSVGYFYGVILVYIIFLIYYWHEGIAPFKYLMGIGLFFHLFCFFIASMLSYDIFKPLVFVYLVFVSAIIYPMALVFWQLGQITTLLWFVLIPVASMIFYSARVVLFWSIYIFILICSVFIVLPFLPEAPLLEITWKQLVVINVITVILFLFLLFYFLYSLNVVNQIKIDESKRSENHLLDDGNIVIRDNEKFNQLYSSITNYLAKKKPYVDSDFTVSQLAATLDTNITYIAKALKQNKNVNFNIFINTYRVDMVKEMLDNDYHNKYTMRYIYTSSGFRHQSTFNKVFKQIEGITPSDYLKKIEATHQVKLDHKT